MFTHGDVEQMFEQSAEYLLQKEHLHVDLVVGEEFV